MPDQKIEPPTEKDIENNAMGGKCADLNALFVTTVGIGYLWPYRAPDRYRWYLWLMGPVLKGAGAATFVADHLLRGSPASFLLFAACDGILAVVTLYALLATSGRPASRGVAETLR